MAQPGDVGKEEARVSADWIRTEGEASKVRHDALHGVGWRGGQRRRRAAHARRRPRRPPRRRRGEIHGKGGSPQGGRQGSECPVRKERGGHAAGDNPRSRRRRRRRSSSAAARPRVDIHRLRPFPRFGCCPLAAPAAPAEQRSPPLLRRERDERLCNRVRARGCSGCGGRGRRLAHLLLLERRRGFREGSHAQLCEAGEAQDLHGGGSRGLRLAQAQAVFMSMVRNTPATARRKRNGNMRAPSASMRHEMKMTTLLFCFTRLQRPRCAATVGLVG